MEKFKKIILSFSILISVPLNAQLYPWHIIPERQIILDELFSSINTSGNVKITVKKFELSHSQVSLADYKIFLNTVKKDSGELVYQSLLPDTNIGPKDVRDEYFNSGKYDNYPVIGISWENTLKYCRWFTISHNKDSLTKIYRLPNLYEYYSAYTYLQSNAVYNNLDDLYADWLMDTKDESLFTNQEDIALSYYYFHSKNDSPVMKRKMVIGKSYLHSFDKLEDYLKLSFYGDNGYRHVGFRMIQDNQPESFLINETNGDYENPILNYWKIKPKP